MAGQAAAAIAGKEPWDKRVKSWLLACPDADAARREAAKVGSGNVGVAEEVGVWEGLGVASSLISCSPHAAVCVCAREKEER